MASEGLSPQAKAAYHEYFHGRESRELRRIKAMRLTDGERDVLAEQERDARDCEEGMAMEPKRLKPSDILEWLSCVVGQAEADGYQQNEDSKEVWYDSGFCPEILWYADNIMMVRARNGDQFVVKVTKARAKG